MKKSVLSLLYFVLFASLSIAQDKSGRELENQLNLVFGVGQVVQSGFNAEFNVMWKRVSFDYSHGISLNLPNESLESGSDKEQGLAIQIPWTTGFGIGYRFNDWLNLRAEPKWHRFELFFDGDEKIDQNLIGDYTTFTLGLGLYANLKPFKKQDNFLKGIMIAPNVRWWPRLSSSLRNDELRYTSRNTNIIETHEARDIGIANTPFFFNVSIGYSIVF